MGLISEKRVFIHPFLPECQFSHRNNRLDQQAKTLAYLSGQWLRQMAETVGVNFIYAADTFHPASCHSQDKREKKSRKQDKKETCDKQPAKGGKNSTFGLK